MWTVPARLALAFALAPAADCLPLAEPAPPGASAASLAQTAARLAGDLAHAAAPCAPRASLALGLALLDAGNASDALAPLVRATAALEADRGYGFEALGRAQALTGDPFAALRSLAMAERLLAPASPARERALDAATLLVRLFVRPGGSPAGTYRFDVEFLATLKDEIGSPRALAAGGERVVALGKNGVAVVAGNAALPPFDAKPQAVAVSPRGAVAVLLEGGRLVRAEGPEVHIAPVGTRSELKATALALGPRDEIWALEREQVHRFDATAAFVKTLATAEVKAIAADARGLLHVLLDGDLGLLVVDGDGREVVKVAATGEGWAWSRADAIATDPVGASYVLARSGGGGAGVVYAFDPAGRFVGQIDPPAEDRSLLHDARALAVDRAGNVYVLTSKGTVVRYR